MQQNMQNEIPLHDIKPLLEIQDYSFYYFLALMIVGGLILLALLYLLYRYFVQRNRRNIKKEHYKILKGINLAETKKAAYLLTQYGATFKDDSPRHLKTYNEMVEKLERYKYKKSVDAFDGETRRVIELFRGMIDV
jgi:hypothetical protein